MHFRRVKEEYQYHNLREGMLMYGNAQIAFEFPRGYFALSASVLSNSIGFGKHTFLDDFLERFFRHALIHLLLHSSDKEGLGMSIVRVRGQRIVSW